MKTPALRASLRLWRWRLHRHEAKLKKAKPGERRKYKNLVEKDQYMVARRLHQLQAQQPKPHHDRDWLPGATRKAATNGTPWQVDCAPKGILHTTEGLNFEAMDRVLRDKDARPHFLVGRNKNEIIQYYPLSIGSRALVHDGPPTNGAHAIQIEVCAYAARPNWPDEQKDAVRHVMRFIEENAGVERKAGANFTTPQRLTPAAWLKAKGWLGHVHVPGNSHWDPGKINIRELLR